MSKSLCILLAALALTGCSKSIQNEGEEQDGYPKGTKKIIVPGGYAHYVIPLKMDDGTFCVVVAKNSQGGAAISCNFTKDQP